MNWLLPEESDLSFEGIEQPLRILSGLGGGTQGQVYAAQVGAEQLALKWYLPACIQRDPQLRNRLRQSIVLGSPNADFLWPLALLEPSASTKLLIRHRQAGFGYLMRLRPSAYVGAYLHAAGVLEISLQNVLRACFFLADGFHQLHLKGLCYKDISLGNLFIDPNSGRILICDNDNVDIDGRGQGTVLGTPGFIAPEVLLGQVRPGTTSDLFSLAVLIFRLLTRHDPFRGQMELEIRCLDEPARRRLYGEDPVFIFNPSDPRNRPDPIEHAAALITWPIYPNSLKLLFEQSFVTGLRDRYQRALTGQWKLALARCLDQRQLCSHCGQENFPEHQSSTNKCWSCGTILPKPLSLQLPRGLVVAANGNELYPHHFDRYASEDLRQPLGRLVAHPHDNGILGLKNLTEQCWQVRRRNGQVISLEPGMTCNLTALQQIDCCSGTITALR